MWGSVLQFHVDIINLTPYFQIVIKRIHSLGLKVPPLIFQEIDPYFPVLVWLSYTYN